MNKHRVFESSAYMRRAHPVVMPQNEGRGSFHRKSDYGSSGANNLLRYRKFCFEILTYDGNLLEDCTFWRPQISLVMYQYTLIDCVFID
jgi:hypothetical protein